MASSDSGTSNAAGNPCRDSATAMLPADPPISAANCRACSVFVPSGSGYRSRPARPTTMAAMRLARSNARIMSDAPPLARTAGFYFFAGRKHLRARADLRRCYVPPGVPTLGPCIGIDLDFDHIGAVRFLRPGEGGIEFIDAPDSFRMRTHRTRMHRKINRNGACDSLPVRDVVVEWNIAGVALQFVDDRKPTVIAQDDDELAPGHHAGIDIAVQQQVGAVADKNNGIAAGRPFQLSNARTPPSGDLIAHARIAVLNID